MCRGLLPQLRGSNQASCKPPFLESLALAEAVAAAASARIETRCGDEVGGHLLTLSCRARIHTSARRLTNAHDGVINPLEARHTHKPPINPFYQPWASVYLQCKLGANLPLQVQSTLILRKEHELPRKCHGDSGQFGNSPSSYSLLKKPPMNMSYYSS